jgi:hypothetical protein
VNAFTVRRHARLQKGLQTGRGEGSAPPSLIDFGAAEVKEPRFLFYTRGQLGGAVNVVPFVCSLSLVWAQRQFQGQRYCLGSWAKDGQQQFHPAAAALFDHPIRTRQNIGRNRETDLPCGFEVDDKLKLHRRLHRQLRRLPTLEELVHVYGSATVLIIEV